MPDSLDLTVAAALMRWRLIERALHDHKPWSMQYAGVTVPATRFIRADRISFVAHFPAMCPLTEPEYAVTLLCDGEPLRVLSIDEPLDEDGSRVWLDLAIQSPVPVE